jgi:cytochrome b involved in lipid metabolism
MAEDGNVPVVPPDVSPKLEKYTMEEIGKHCTRESAWIAIHADIYDVSKFLDEHPGGEEVLLEQAGKDGSEAFDDVGHSTDAREMMKQYKIGELCDKDKEALKKKAEKENEERLEANTSSWRSWLLPVALAAGASFIYRYYLAHIFASSARQ